MKKSTIWLVIILLLAAFLRLYDLKNVPPGLWADEAVNGVNTLQALADGWKVFYPENFGREGLFINIQSLFVWALGTEPWVLRLPSAIIGILTVLGLYLMVKELFKSANSESNTNKRIALFAAFFLATSFWHINFSRIGFRAIMAPFFLVWAFYFLFLAMRKSKEWFFAAAGLVFGLGFHTYLAYRIAPIIALYPLWVFYKSWKEEAVKPPLGGLTAKSEACAPCLIVLFIIMAVLAASPLLIYYAKNPADFFGRTSGISIFQSPNPLAQFSENFVKTFQMFFLFGDFNWRHNFAGASQLWWPIGLLFLLGLWLSIKQLISTSINKYQQVSDIHRYSLYDINGYSLKFILLWFVIMLLPVAISNEGLPHALRAIVLIPPSMIFAALGLNFIIEKSKQRLHLAVAPPSERLRLELTILLFVFFLAATAHAFNTYFLRWAPNYNVYQSFQADITEKARWLKNQPAGKAGQPNDIKKYVVTGEVNQIDLTGSPMSLQPIIFITDTFFASKQKEKNIYYVALKDWGNISCESGCVVIPVESDPRLFRSIKQKIPSLRLDVSQGFVTFRK